jgi:hypothetical protein
LKILNIVYNQCRYRRGHPSYTSHRSSLQVELEQELELEQGHEELELGKI